MWKLKDGDMFRYRCHIGHVCTGDLIAVGLYQRLKRGMAAALRALNERTALVTKLRASRRTKAGLTSQKRRHSGHRSSKRKPN
jgi:two-component system, chemotaxis family, protein-glutamate methylesterase/glutaminase